MADDQARDELRRSAPLPPVTSQPGAGSVTPVHGNAQMAAPFVGRPTFAVSETKIEDTVSFEDVPWSQEPADETGEVAAVFEADVSETEAALAALSMASRADEFPLDAFIIPEHAQRIPNGFEGKALPEARVHTPITEMADRLEKLSHRLRVEQTDTLIARLAGGDKIDALLAGLLAGYVSGSK